MTQGGNDYLAGLFLAEPSIPQDKSMAYARGTHTIIGTWQDVILDCLDTVFRFWVLSTLSFAHCLAQILDRCKVVAANVDVLSLSLSKETIDVLGCIALHWVNFRFSNPMSFYRALVVQDCR